jgi:hypothetical protein
MATKQTALATATKKPANPEAWVAEKPKAAAPPEKMGRLVVEMPADMHRDLKIRCVTDGLKIKDVVQGLIADYLAGKNKRT